MGGWRTGVADEGREEVRWCAGGGEAFYAMMRYDAIRADVNVRLYEQPHSSFVAVRAATMILPFYF